MIPDNIIANADDFGFDEVISDAIILSYQQGLINSTSMIVNSGYFDDAVVLIKQNPIVKNIGVHINLTLGRPLTNINNRFLDKYGCWNPLVTNRFLNLYPSRTSEVFFAEICTQIERLLEQGIEVNHLDSHHHVHILPCYIALFMRAAKKYNLKLRLAQTRGSGNLFKHLYRQEINRHIFNENLHYHPILSILALLISITMISKQPVWLN